ncbi:MAG: GFA family protein [Steroidobacteraceae bacterium]
MSEVRLTGGCMCGAVRYELTGAGTNLCYCHCTSCRRAAGAPAVPWGTFARSAFSVTRGRLAEYRSSPEVARGFCRECGTALTYRHERRAAEIDVTLASLDDASALAPQMHVWVGDKLPWVAIGDGLPQFERGVSS